MNWCFAIINNRLAEIYFEKYKGSIKFLSHCYVKKADYKLKKEKRWIAEDIMKVKLFYKKGKYKSKLPVSL